MRKRASRARGSAAAQTLGREEREERERPMRGGKEKGGRDPHTDSENRRKELGARSSGAGASAKHGMAYGVKFPKLVADAANCARNFR